MMDHLRTAYSNAPPWARRSVAPALAIVPQQFRFGGTYMAMRKKISRSRVDAAFVREWQHGHLQTLLAKAHDHAPHYHQLSQHLAERDIVFQDISPETLHRLPILGKDQLRTAPEDFLTIAKKHLDLVSTSGSSGTPLTFYLDKSRSPTEFAFVTDSWTKIGFSQNHKRAVFRGIQISHVDDKPWEYEPALRELRLSPFHMTDTWMARYCDLIVEYGVTFLHGYPSALTILAGYVERNTRLDVQEQIKGIIASSEGLHSHQRNLLSHAFRTNQILSFYGMSEKVAFGSEIIASPGTFEMEPLYGITELVDDEGQPVTSPGCVGRIVATGLLFTGMAFIRYDTGDFAELVEQPGPDNHYRMKLRNITSRWGREFLVGHDGRLISMTAINIHSPAYGKMAAFQFQQDRPGMALLKAVLAPGCHAADLTPFIDEISRKVGSSITFQTEVVESLATNSRGKSKFIDQKLDLSRYQ